MATASYDLTSQVDGLRTSFTTPREFTVGTLLVFVDGQLMRRGAGNDYVETSVNAFTTTRPQPIKPGSTLHVQFETEGAGDVVSFPVVIASGTDPTS